MAAKGKVWRTAGVPEATGVGLGDDGAAGFLAGNRLPHILGGQSHADGVGRVEVGQRNLLAVCGGEAKGGLANLDAVGLVAREATQPLCVWAGCWGAGDNLALCASLPLAIAWAVLVQLCCPLCGVWGHGELFVCDLPEPADAVVDAEVGPVPTAWIETSALLQLLSEKYSYTSSTSPVYAPLNTRLD